MFTTNRGSVAERYQSSFLLLTERGYDNCFLDVGKTWNLRSGLFELKQTHISLTAKPVNKWFPDWLKVMEPPARRRNFL